jgi:magnesium chelatase accessory protein
MNSPGRANGDYRGAQHASTAVRTMDWDRDGADWPLRDASRFVQAGGLRWHVQVLGAGPALLLLHGTGAATHSWRDLAPLLARRFTVIAPDLPGHGFSGRPATRGMSLPGMAQGVTALLQALGAAPVLVVGHSAGAAVAVRMVLDGRVTPGHLVGVNAALWPLAGLLRVMSPLAKLLAMAPMVPRWVSSRAADETAVARLIAGTGSTLDARGAQLYARLMRDPGHVAGALAMMANWQLDALFDDLPRLRTPLTLVVGSADRTVPPAQADAVAARVREARVMRLAGLGHLAHEEDAKQVAGIVWRVHSGPRPPVNPG